MLNFERFEVLTAVLTEFQVFWDRRPCGLFRDLLDCLNTEDEGNTFHRNMDNNLPVYRRFTTDDLNICAELFAV